uniref:MYB family transcription factor n=1 Tax=Melilotus albus TaxID=47082 RepID=A0A896WEI0_MELAB|nr:MYB family transcription factor [Melilotus albus]
MSTVLNSYSCFFFVIENMEGKRIKLFGKYIVVNERTSMQDPFEEQQEKPNNDVIDSGRAVAILNTSDANLIQAESLPEESHAPSRVQRKTMHWTEDEHKLFLKGLKKYGKGRWKDISKEFVVTKTPIQIATHAQKYFIHLNATEKEKKRRRSIHDTSVEEQDEIPSIEKQSEIPHLVTAPIEDQQNEIPPMLCLLYPIELISFSQLYIETESV